MPLESGRLSRDSVFRFDPYPVMSARVGIAVGSLLQELSLLVAGTSDSVARNTALALTHILGTASQIVSEFWN